MDDSDGHDPDAGLEFNMLQQQQLVEHRSLLRVGSQILLLVFGIVLGRMR